MRHTTVKMTEKKAKYIGDKLGVDWSLVDIKQFRRGLEVEQEHWDTTKGQWLTMAKIALDHLAEIPDYYSRLDKMELEAQKYWKDHR